MAQAAITVLQSTVFRDLAEQQLPQDAWEQVIPCEFFHPGQSFLVDDDSALPGGFCPTAWHDLRGKIASALRDDDPLTPLIVCCMDGLRPVTFRIERLEG
ncbi:TIGR04076 family protein [Candidatus Bipolaricaulota bacterium]